MEKNDSWRCVAMGAARKIALGRASNPDWVW